MTQEYKLLSVVFPLYRNEAGEYFVLLGKQAPGKKMPGIRNGPGGKCVPGQSSIDCAVVEVAEEIGAAIVPSDLHYFGKIIADDKRIDFFTTYAVPHTVYEDNSEFVDLRWFKLSEPEAFLHEMLPGDAKLIAELQMFLLQGKEYQEFTIDKTGDEALREITKGIFS